MGGPGQGRDMIDRIVPPEVAILLADLPGIENDPDALERAAGEVEAGRDAEIPNLGRRTVVAAELRRMAAELRRGR